MFQTDLQTANKQRRADFREISPAYTAVVEEFRLNKIWNFIRMKLLQSQLYGHCM